MTDETLAEYEARLHAALVATCGPAEAAQLEARDAAMMACAEVYERALADQLTAIKELEQTEDGLHMLTRIAGVIALDQLRSAALGCDLRSWEVSLRRHRVLVRATIEGAKTIFRKEANNS